MVFQDVETYTGFVVGRYESRYGPCDKRTFVELSAMCGGLFGANFTLERFAFGAGGASSRLLGELVASKDDEVDIFDCDVDGDGSGSVGHAREGRFCDRVDESDGGAVVLQRKDSVVDCRLEDARGCGEDNVVEDGVRIGNVRGVLGSTTLRNRQWRKERKERKVRKKRIACNDSKSCNKDGIDSDVPLWRRKSSACVGNARCDSGGQSVGFGYFAGLDENRRNALRDSRAAKLKAENELLQAKAERALVLLNSSDVDAEKKMRETRVLRETELNKVKIEQAFSRLAVSGNVPGFAETVVSGAPTLSSGSISPNSSVSAAEVHAMQKELLELQAQSARLRDRHPSVYVDICGSDKEKSIDTSFTADTNGHELASYGSFKLHEDGRYRAYDEDFY